MLNKVNYAHYSIPRRQLYPYDGVSFVLSLSDPSILLDLSRSGFTQRMEVVLRRAQWKPG